MKDPNKLTIADYRKGLRKLKRITPLMRLMLSEHVRNKQGSMRFLAQGISPTLSGIGMGSSYGRFARQIGLHLDNSPKRSGERHYWMELICAKSPNRDGDGRNVWIIRNRFVKALEAEGVI